MQCNTRQIDALPNAAPFCAVATCVPTQHTRVTIAQPFVRYRVTTPEWGTGLRAHTSDRQTSRRRVRPSYRPQWLLSAALPWVSAPLALW
jgi:hypothetical protein